MNIKVKEYKIDTLNSTEYKILSIDKCCDKILRNSSINLYNAYIDSPKNIHEPIVSIRQYQSTYECDFDYYYKMNFCPFCGEKIDIKIDSVENVTEEYEKSRKESITKLYRKTKYYLKTDKWEIEKDEYDYFD